MQKYISSPVCAPEPSRIDVCIQWRHITLPTFTTTLKLENLIGSVKQYLSRICINYMEERGRGYPSQV